MAQIYDSTHSGQQVDAAVDAALTTIPAQLTQIGLNLDRKAEQTALDEVSLGLAGVKKVVRTGEEEDTFYISDANGNVVAKIDANGLTTTSARIKNSNGVLSDVAEWIESKTDIDSPVLLAASTLSKRVRLQEENGYYITDGNGNIFFSVALNAQGEYELNYVGKNGYDWRGKVLSTYGDSVTAINNGNFVKPYSYDTISKERMWGNRVADYFGMSAQYGRGIGGQGYRWGTAAGSGGSVTFINADGTLNSRNDSYNYDNYEGNVDVPSGTTPVRGCLASWLRITTMYPASIKDTIDVVLVMAHNDAYDITGCTFVENDTTDPEWAASGADYYGKIGGDYNLSTFRGGVASTIMKLQLWMPQAVIVLMTGISGQGATGELNTDINNVSSVNKAKAIKDMSLLLSVPCIDVFRNDGINGWNRTDYITDTIHPYSEAGGKMIARAVIGGMKCILPLDVLD